LVRKKIYLNFAASQFSRIYIATEKDTEGLTGAVLVQDLKSGSQLSELIFYLRYAPFILASAICHPVIWLSQTYAEIRLKSRRLESIYISAIYVKKSDQGNGIGSALIQKVKFDYPSKKFTVMTESNNEKAIDFYLSTNWKVEARCHNTLLLTLDV
jgi:GNAT superfamily N-acetyltransferase